jgi:hypothetical protein
VASFSTTFTQSDGAAADFTDISGAGTPQVVGNVYVGVNGSESGARSNTAATTGYQEVIATCVTPTGQQMRGLWVYGTTSAEGYGFRKYTFDGSYNATKGGSGNWIGEFGAGPGAADDGVAHVYRLTAEPSGANVKLTLYRDGTLIGTMTDTTSVLSGTYGGIHKDAGSGGTTVDDYTFGDFTPPNYPQITATGGEIGTSLGAANAQTLPTGSTTGDLVIVWVTNDNPSTTNITASTGWTQLFHAGVTGDVVKHAAFARVLDGGANDTLTITGAAQDYCVSSARIPSGDHGVSAGSIATDIKAATPATATSGSANPPSLAAGSSKEWLWIASAGVDFTTGNTISADPSGYTLVDNRTSASSTSSCGQRVSSREFTGSTEDPAAYTNTSQEWVAGTIAIPPFVAAPPAAPALFVRRPPSLTYR